MIARLTRILASFLVVLTAYGLYVLLAVPWIEPNTAKKILSNELRQRRLTTWTPNNLYQNMFNQYFPAGHWAHKKPKVLQSRQTVLLFDEYHSTDGGVKLKPCAILSFPQGRSQSGKRSRAPVILEAPAGALLQFEGDFDLAHPRKIGKPVHGKLLGTVTIHSEMDHPGSEDDLKIITRDVEMTKNRLWTHHDIWFHLGKNHGEGTDLEIRLSDTSDDEHTNNASEARGIEWLELKRNVKVHLAMDNADFFSVRDVTPNASNGNKKNVLSKGTENNSEDPPVEISCLGPFRFDVRRQVASFEDQVNVLRLIQQGPSDTLSCQVLLIHFGLTQNTNYATSPREPHKGADSEHRLPHVKTLVAEGDPVKVDSPSRGAKVRCQRLEYDVNTKKLSLKSADQVMMMDSIRTIVTPELTYQQSSLPGKLPLVWAAGPGHLVAISDDNHSERFEAHWNEKLHLRRYEGNPVVSLWGQSEVALTGYGCLQSDEIHLYLDDSRSTGPTNSLSSVVPKRMIATSTPDDVHHVNVQSPQLTGSLSQLGIWFVQRSHPLEKNPAAMPLDQSPTTSPRPRPPQNHYHVEGAHLHVEMNMCQRDFQVSKLTLDGNVLLRETKTSKTDEQPLRVRGDRLTVYRADLPSTHITVTGKPASIEGRQMLIHSARLDIDRSANRFWTDHPGKMSFPLTRDFNGRPLDGNSRLVINWEHQMNFDGKTINFEQSIVAQSDAWKLETDSLVATLSQKVHFDKPIASKLIEVDSIVCQKPLRFLGQTHDERTGEKISVDQLEARHGEFHRRTGNILASGPGQITRVWIGKADTLLPNADHTSPSSNLDQGALNFLNVHFLHSLAGNVYQRELRLHRHVDTTFGLVPHWDATLDVDITKPLSEDTMRLTTDTLTLREITNQHHQRQNFELLASGNTEAEGRTFTAEGNRLSYSQEKDLIVLEGTGPQGARLSHQEHIGGPVSDTFARKIFYWRGTGVVTGEDVRFGNLLQTARNKDDNVPVSTPSK